MIYGVTGKKRSGKSTSSAYLQEKTGAVRVNFKDALVKEIREKFPDLLEAIRETMDHTKYDGWVWTVDKLFTEKPPLVRALLQNYGTEVRRKDDSDYWVAKWVQAAKNHKDVIVDDVRFLNEAEAVRAMGGIIIRIERTDLTATDTHQSETEMDAIEADYTISVKTGQLDLLYQNIDFIFTELNAPHKLAVIHQ